MQSVWSNLYPFVHFLYSNSKKVLGSVLSTSLIVSLFSACKLNRQLSDDLTNDQWRI